MAKSANTAPAGPLPLSSTQTPDDVAGLIVQVRSCFGSETPVYPIGGGTSLDQGVPGKTPGLGLSLSKLNRVIDYPARDMTVTVEAGMTMQALSELLASENQQLPIDVPRRTEATVGGVIATNFNGPRRFGYGTVRDYVIGIQAVDGRGMPFKGGGRVVKNVAGYDFCKLLTGSLGTLGVITQVTLKLKPRAETSCCVGCGVEDLDRVERLLESLVHSETTPVAVMLLCGPAWEADDGLKSLSRGGRRPPWTLVALLEGSEAETRWMTAQLQREWQPLTGQSPVVWDETASAALLARAVEFPQAELAPLVLKASVRASRTTRFLAAVREIDSRASIVSHAGNGVVLVRFSEFPSAGLSRTLVARLQAEAAAADGHVVVLSNPSGSEMTTRSVWDVGGLPLEMMTSVKRQFDPKNLLNPGRFVY